MLSKERSSLTSLQDPPTGRTVVVSDARRRLVKGGFMAAPVLLTLPRVSSAQASNQMCVEPKNGLTEAEGVSASGLGNYVAVARPAFKITISGVDHIVVYGGYTYTTLATACADTSGWHDAASWTTTYLPQSCSGSGPGAFSDGINTHTATAVGNYSVIVQVDVTGTPIGVIGPTGGSTHIITTSCWASAMAGTSLPQ
ncbi:hypothetical protein [Methylomagnum sp.]